MKPPPSSSTTENAPQNSKKRQFSVSSSRCMDSDDVVEIPCPVSRASRTPKSHKHKEVIVHDVIEIDKDEDSVAGIHIDDRVDRSVKGKAKRHSCDGYHDHQAKHFQEAMLNDLFGGPSGMETLGSGNGIEATKSFAPANLINLDGPGSDLLYDDDECADFFLDEFMDGDEYAQLQAHFDNVDIPPGIEAPIPWLSDPFKSKLTSVSGSSSVTKKPQMQPDAVSLLGNNPLVYPWSLLPDHFNQKPFLGGSSSLMTQLDIDAHPPTLDPSSTWKHAKSGRSRKKLPTLQHKGSVSSNPVGVESSKSEWILGSHQLKKKLASSSSSTNYNSANQFDATKLAFGTAASSMAYFKDLVKKKKSSTSYNPPALQPPGPWGPHPSSISTSYHSSFFDPLGSVYPPGGVEVSPWVVNAQTQNNIAPAVSSTTPVMKLSSVDIVEINEKFKGFKQFDTIEDHSDHHYTGQGSSTHQPPKNWAKRIQEEWKILEKDLPSTIFVRVYETRMDLLRAVIVGAEGTPYHDGLFFFDVFFPSGYPNVPPKVYYHSGGLRLNPNLYACGKVCLSLLNTWSGNKNEKWLPKVSTMLQVLVSIQGLILNTKPYFNEPGYARTNGSPAGEQASLVYNEDTFILSLRTMVYIMRRPPKHFEDFVLGHFFHRAHDILVACKAYMDGAQVGCLVRGGVQDVDEGDKSCSQPFKDSLAGYVPMLVTEFTRIGAKDCEKFLSLETGGNKHIPRMPKAAASMVSC